MKGGAAPQREGHEDKAFQCRQLKFDDGEEEHDGKHEERDQGHDPRQRHQHDFGEMPEYFGEAGQTLNLAEQNVGALNAGLGEFSGVQEICVCEPRTCSLQTEGREAVEDNLCEVVPVIQEKREKSDVEDLLREGLDDLVLSSRPRQCCKGSIDPNENLDKEPDVTGNQAEAAIDIPAEDVKKVVDNGCIVTHEVDQPSLPSASAVPAAGRYGADVEKPALAPRVRRSIPEEPLVLSNPRGLASRVIDRRHPELLATIKLGVEQTVICNKLIDRLRGCNHRCERKERGRSNNGMYLHGDDPPNT